MKQNKPKTINWKVLIGYLFMFSTFLSVGLYFSYDYAIILIPILWLSWLIYSVYLLTKPEFKFHGKILFGVWFLIILLLIGYILLLLFIPSGPSSISKVISVIDLQCKDGKITIVLSNDGTKNITDSELNVYISGINKSEQFYFNPDTISPENRAIAISTDIYEMNRFYEVRVIAPSNTVGGTVEC
jgi:hypothetical protein